jgi:hypothetical protein
MLSESCFIVEYGLPIHFWGMNALLELWRARKPLLEVCCHFVVYFYGVGYDRLWSL